MWIRECGIARWCRAWALLFAGCGASALGQSAVDGAIGGRVADQRGDSLVGARISVKSAATGAAQVAVSGADGSFLVARLSPGAYQVAIAAPGFRPVTEQVTVELGAVANADARLALEEVMTLLSVEAAPVNVPGASPVPEAAAPRSGDMQGDVQGNAVTTAEQVDLLPVDGRRWQTFALLLPAANAGSCAAESEAAVSFRGLAVTQNAGESDGASDMQSFGSVARGTGGGAGREAEEPGDSGSETGVGGDGARAQYGRHAGAAYTFAQGAVQEFRIRAARYSADSYSALDGHAAGGVVTTVSKSGTAAVHGSGFYLARDSAWGATNPFSLATHYADGVVTAGYVKPEDLRQQFGASLGGPVRLSSRLQPGKLFYFATADVQRRRNPAVSSPGYAQFYALTATQQALLANRGVSRDQTNAALNYLDSLTGTVTRREDQQIAFGKLDWEATAKNRLSAQVNRVRWNSPGGVRSAPVVERGLASLGNSYGKVDAGVARWVSLWTTHLSNEVRLACGRDFEYETAQAPLAQEPAIGPSGLAPEVSIGPNGFAFGTPASLGRKAYPDERRLQVAEMVEWSHRRLLLQAGFDFSAIHDRIDALANQEGSFHYDSGATAGKAGGLVDWITDYTFSANAYPNGACPSINAKDHLFCFRTFTQSFGRSAVSFRTAEWAGFVQEEWRATATLHLSAGLRYEYEREPVPQYPNASLDTLFGAGTSSRGGATSVFPEDGNNFGPRLGIAWQPLGPGKGTVHLGYGVYFGRLPGATVRAALIDTALPAAAGSNRSATHVRITPATETLCPQVANQGFGYGCDFVTQPGSAVAATTTATVFDRRFRLPMVQQGSFGIERGIGHGMTASASYVINLDRQLPDSVDINIAPSTATKTFQLQGGPVNGSGPAGVTNGQVFVVPFYSARVSTLYGPVTDIVSNANGTYNALVVEATRRSRKGLQFGASWTWAKAIDYGESTSATPKTNGQFDPFTNGYDKGLSTLNFAHKVTASAAWEPVLVTPRRWLRAAANGWQIDPLLQVVSGRPYSYEIFGGTRLTGGHTSINGSGGAAYLPTVGRNTLRLPETVHLDLRVGKGVKLTERIRARATAEVFNLPNHVNYTSTTTRAYQPGVVVNGVTPLVFQDAATVASEGLNEQPFGAFTAASTANSRERQVQLGLRLEF
jgi:hypothetical protein